MLLTQPHLSTSPYGHCHPTHKPATALVYYFQILLLSIDIWFIQMAHLAGMKSIPKGVYLLKYFYAIFHTNQGG